jgi:hypothetical protein
VASEALTYQALEHEIKKRTISHAFLQGPGGPLLFLWVLGAGVLGVVLAQPLWALVVTGLCAVSGALMVRDHLRHAHIQRQLIHALIAERARLGDIAQNALREKVANGVTCVTEIVVKIRAITRRHGTDADLFRLLGEADGMVALQVDLANQSEEFQRILTLIDRSGASRGESRREETPPHTTRLRQENLTALRDARDKALASIDEINQQLETLVLQVVQMEKQTIDLVRAEEVAEQATQTLRRFQVDLDTRRATADELLRLLR